MRSIFCHGVLGKFAIPVLVCSWFFSITGLSQPVRTSADADPGKAVDSLIQRKMAEEQIPGVQIAVVKHGKLVKAGNYGISNVELNSPVTSETVFEIASNSKQFTAGAILLLREDKKLDLDDLVAKYIKGLPREYDSVTIRQLLNHTSGVKDYIEEFALNRQTDHTDQQLIERIGANKLNFSPGENARYSTTGYLLLGIVIENITGHPYGEFLSERIFKPLGMQHTRVNNLVEVVKGRAAGYMFDKGKLVHGRYVAQTLRASADIGLLTTATDMAKWDIALNGNKIFSDESLRIMFTPGTLSNGDLARNEWNGYFGAGWFVDDYLGIREIDHGGTLISGFHCNISRFVDKGLTIIVLTNRLRSRPSILGYSIAGLYDTSLRPPHMKKIERDDDPRRTGRISDILTNIAGGGNDGRWLTTGFSSWLSSESGPRSEIKNAFSDGDALLFISCKKATAYTLERLGSKIDTICSYKTGTGPQKHYVTAYFDPDDKLADAWIYDYSR